MYEINQNKLDSILEIKKVSDVNFPKIAVFIVSYNAGSKLAETINRIPEKLIPVIAEIYVFDDFSQDNSFEIGRKLMELNKWKGKLKVYKNIKNFGYGGNQKIGFKYGILNNFDFIILLHADGQYAPEYLPDLIFEALKNNYDVVFGSRMLTPLMAIKGGMPLYKWIGNRILTIFENLLLGLKLSEFHSGYRLYSTKFLKKIYFEENTDDFHFDTQIIIQCRMLNIPIREIPIPTYYGDEICYVNGLKYAFCVALSVIEYRLHQLRFIHRKRYIPNVEEEYLYKKSPFSSHQKIIKLIKNNSTVLDCGCGKGFLGSDLKKKKGVYIVGMDNLPKENTDFDEYYQVDLENISELNFGRKFDYIILSDVIEHIKNAEKLLLTLSDYLKPNGKLIVSTGNIAIWFYRLSLLIGRFNYGTRGILDKTHVHLYTIDTFKSLINNCNFKVVKVSFTSLPFELIFSSTRKNLLIIILDTFYYFLTKIWPRLFAYQIIIEAELSSLNIVKGEGKISV